MSDRELTYAEAIKEALHEEMARDEKVFLMGEDIKISVYGVTRGLVELFGAERVMQMPIAENGFCAAALGAAVTGYRPVVELMYGDFLLVAADAIFNQIAKIHYISGGTYQAPVTIRVAGSGMGARGGAHHSQSLEALPVHFPGLKVVFPSTPYDAKGLLKSAIRDDDPVLFFEHKLLYGTKGFVPVEEYLLPIGEGVIQRRGKDVTVVAYGQMCRIALKAAEELSRAQGIELEVYDPRSLRPFAYQPLFNSLEKTGKLLIVEEGTKIGGMGAEIAATVAEERLYLLEAPIVRLAGAETPAPASQKGHQAVIPNHEDIKTEVLKLLQLS